MYDFRLMLRLILIAVMGLGMVGCRSPQYVIPLGARSPAACGNIRLYATDNVPFEYEELGAIGGLYHKVKSEDQRLRAFVAEARKLGADAIVNFSQEPAIGALVIFGFGGDDPTVYTKMTGAAIAKEAAMRILAIADLADLQWIGGDGNADVLISCGDIMVRRDQASYSAISPSKNGL